LEAGVLPSTLIDDFSNHALWSAFDPGSLPSTEVSLSTDAAVYADVESTTSMRVEMSATADGHFITRSFAPINFMDYSELRLWIRATDPADGTPDQPFHLKLELGSAAMPIGAPGNDWHRYLPVPETGRWQFVRISLDDLAPLVSNAVDTIRMTAVNVSTSWTAWLDELIVSEPQMIADVDAAITKLLDGVLVIGVPVPAEVHVPGAPEPTSPWIRIVLYEAAYSDLRTNGQKRRTDFSDSGFHLRPESVAYDLFYRIEPVTDDRLEHRQMVEFVLDVLGHRRSLYVNGVQLPFDRIEAHHEDDILANVPALRYRVATRKERGMPEIVAPVGEVTLDMDIGS
jgi:hypothetical protein